MHVYKSNQLSNTTSNTLNVRLEYCLIFIIIWSKLWKVQRELHWIIVLMLEILVLALIGRTKKRTNERDIEACSNKEINSVIRMSFALSNFYDIKLK